MPSDRRPVEPEPDWLGIYTRKFYYLPALALWRALEARALGPDPLPSPSLDVGVLEGSFASAWLRDLPPIDFGLDLQPVRTPDTRRAYRMLIKGDAERLPFPDGALASVLCNSVIEHVERDEAAIAEFGRVLRRGGLLLLTAPTDHFHSMLHGVREARRRGDEAAAEAYARAADERLYHRRYRSLEAWRRILEAAGLEVEASRYYLPGDVAEFWDREDDAWTRPLLGRPRYMWLVGRLGRRLRGPLASYGRRAVAREFARAVAGESADVPGAGIMIRAVRRA